MTTTKIHLIKQFQEHIKISFPKNSTQDERILILGPLDISPLFLKKAIKTCSPTLIILIDGGNSHKSKLTYKEQLMSLTVGDGDSIKKEKIKEVDFILPLVKDYSDLSFVMEALGKMKVASVNLWGLSSLLRENRYDHLLFNLGALVKLAKTLKIEVTMDGRFIAIPEGKKTLIYRGIFSLIAFSDTFVKIKGDCEYKLPTWTKLSKLSSQGLSNIAFGSPITIESTKPLLIYLVGTKTNS